MNSLEIVNLVIYIILAVIIFAFFFLAVKVWLESESGLIILGRYDKEIKQKKAKKEHKVWKFIRNILSGIILGGFITIAIGLFVTTTINSLDLGAIIFLGIVCTAIAHSIYVNSLKKIKVQTASIISSMESVYSIIFAFLLLNETLAFKELLGGLIIIGVAIYLSFNN